MLEKEIYPVVRRRVARWLFIVIAITLLIMTISFILYFFILFATLFTPETISSWTGLDIEETLFPISVFGIVRAISLHSSFAPILKVSATLALFISAIASVRGITDPKTLEIFTTWITKKSSDWMSISSLYLSAHSHNYQISKYVVRDRKKGIANVFIVIPEGLSNEEIKIACEHIEQRLTAFKNLVMVTAFEQNVARPVYELGMPGKRWRLLVNKSKNIRKFEEIPLELDDPRFDHFLGEESIRGGESIPDEWFGNSEKAIKLGKEIWANDSEHEWVLHPYVYKTGSLVSLEIAFYKRYSSRKEYRRFVKRLYQLAFSQFESLDTLLIDISYRDTLESLARFRRHRELPYVDYKDESMEETKHERKSKWD